MAGVEFPQGGDGKRSTTATGRAILADAVRPVDPALAGRIDVTRDWRSGYIPLARQVAICSARSNEVDAVVAESGLASAHQRFEFIRDDVTSTIEAALARTTAPGFGSVTVRGAAPRPDGLVLPYRGERLSGDDLRRQVDTWVTSGVAEPGLAVAVHALLDNPDWLDCSDLDVAVLGAAAEMAPTRALLAWGARIHAVELPREATWRRLIGRVRRSAGSMRVPVRLDAAGRSDIVLGGVLHPDDDAVIAARAGGDLLVDTPELRTWLGEVDGPLVVGTYAYADGSTHARLSISSDAIAASLAAERPGTTTLAFLATPTDAFAVPMAAVAESRRRWAERGLLGALQMPLRLVGQFEQNYPQTYVDDAGHEFGVNDALISQQGPNYLLAKRLQRWRASAARHAGIRTSMNVAPATRTQSVISNRALAAAYAGAGRFGVEIFDASTSSVLMAALLVHDLRNPAAVANPATALASPVDAYAGTAIHGGLWRSAYAPRSVLGIAAILGITRSR